MEGFFFVPVVLFLTIVAPLWLILHYVHKSKASKGAGAVDMEGLDELLESVDKLTDRVVTLEEILDRDHPTWRKKD